MSYRSLQTVRMRMLGEVHSIRTGIKYGYNILLLSLFEQLDLIFSWVSNYNARILFCYEAAD